jgi:hypothetical protein
MMKKLSINIFLILTLAILFSSCSEEFTYKRRTNLLTDKTWRINTFVNYSQNTTTEFRNADYIFSSDSSMIKIYENNDTVTTKWALSPDTEFLTIGSNTFRITELTSKVMSLRYGDVEMFFVPVK